MSAFERKADVNHCVGECPLLAISGHLLVRRVLLGALGPDRLAACLGDLSMRLPQVRTARSLPPRAHDDTGPGRQPARRSDIDKRGRGPGGPVPRPVPVEVDPTRVGKVVCKPPRATSRRSTVARNDHVTPPSVYGQVTPRPRRETPGPDRVRGKRGAGSRALGRSDL